MAEDCTVVRFSRDQATARIERFKQNDLNNDKYVDCGQNFGLFYVFCISISIITYVLDLVSTSLLLYYYIQTDGVYFSLTLAFMIVPALFMTTFSLRWYIVDHDDPSLGKTSLPQWIIRIFFLILHIAPLLRYIDTLVYGIRSKIARAAGHENKQTIFYRRMLDEDTNGALLRLFHCFLHAAPQAIIQLRRLIKTCVQDQPLDSLSQEIVIIQFWTVIVSLVSIGWSLTSYHRSVRYARDDKDKIDWIGSIIAFCWHFTSAVSRVLALSLLSAVYPVWMGCVCAVHWGVMAFWLALGNHQTAACGNRCEELLLSTALGLAYVVAFISPRDGQTRYVYLAYYLVCFMENTAALVVWYVVKNSLENYVLYYGTAGTQVVAFIMGLIFMLIYYRFCHPTTSGSTKTLDITDPATPDVEKASYSKSYNYS